MRHGEVEQNKISKNPNAKANQMARQFFLCPTHSDFTKKVPWRKGRWQGLIA